MNFSNDKAIYVQIAERLSDEILAGKYKEDERIPSVREYAVLLEVNANTAVKAYDLLATDEIIYNKRGLGYFVSAGAKKQIKKTRKKEYVYCFIVTENHNTLALKFYHSYRFLLFILLLFS